ncbi:MAG: hypothetical protein JNK15_13125 [Planctomycetes bacterium]|nr:hypothetical protein [Planctomycetota bacterium]
MKGLRGWVAGMAALFAACRTPVEPEPIAGPVPSSIAVWPFVLGAPGADGNLVLSGLAPAVVARGYRVIAPGVTEQLLLDRGLDAGGPVVPAKDAIAADAVLQVVVREFTARGKAPLQEARWDLQWRLVVPGSGAVAWQWSHRGGWRHDPGDVGDPHRALDAEPELVPIGGRGRPPFRDVQELLANLHRSAMDHLPRCSR